MSGKPISTGLVGGPSACSAAGLPSRRQLPAYPRNCRRRDRPARDCSALPATMAHRHESAACFRRILCAPARVGTGRAVKSRYRPAESRFWHVAKRTGFVAIHRELFVVQHLAEQLDLLNLVAGGLAIRSRVWFSVLSISVSRRVISASTSGVSTAAVGSVASARALVHVMTAADPSSPVVITAAIQ
jgi:hypothetical protein